MERITVDLSRDVQALDRIMKTDRVIRSHGDGTVSVERGTYAPEVSCETDDDGQISKEDDASMVASIERQGWKVESGWSGQYLYSGPIMHVSEFVGGRVAEHVLETDGLWVAVDVYVDSDGCKLSAPCAPCMDGTGRDRDQNKAGWLLCFREDGNE